MNISIIFQKVAIVFLHTYAKMFVAEIMLSKKSFKIIG